jgi:hypothetical protein
MGLPRGLGYCRSEIPFLAGATAAAASHCAGRLSSRGHSQPPWGRGSRGKRDRCRWKRRSPAGWRERELEGERRGRSGDRRRAGSFPLWRRVPKSAAGRQAVRPRADRRRWAPQDRFDEGTREARLGESGLACFGEPVPTSRWLGHGRQRRREEEGEHTPSDPLTRTELKNEDQREEKTDRH